MKHTGKRILFVMRSAEFFHYYRTIIVALLERGHQVRVLTTVKWSKDMELGAFAEFKEEYPAFSYGWAITRTGVWQKILFHTREILSYRRYAVLGVRQSEYYESRYLSYLPPLVQKIVTLPVSKPFVKSEFFANVLRFIERSAPSDPAIIADIKGYAPDVLIASPVNMRFPSSDLEYLKEAAAMGIPTALPVISWDNLTTKGLMHAFPDILLVWNDVQAEEAIQHQSMPRDRIRIIGAPVFDSWFDGHSPSMSREDFCRNHNLRVQHPIVTYLGSSVHMAEDESWLVAALRKALDESGNARLVHTQIIVRPHPGNCRIYEKLKLKDVIILPKEGTLPDGHASLQLFYDTLFYSAAAIDGANTSGIIDSIIVGKPCIAILTDEYRATQQDTQHFRQLLDADALYLAHGAKEFPEVMQRILDGHDERRIKREAFVKKYIRPLGLENTAGRAAADEIEKLLSRR